MIIPPDPEKDPNIFSPSSSTPSLVPPPSELDSADPSSEDSSSTARLQRPRRAHTTNHAFGYPFGDDLGVGYSGEALPPYERQRIEEGDVFADPPEVSSSPTPTRRSPRRTPSGRTANQGRPSLIISTSQPTAPSPLTDTPDDNLLTASSSTARLPLTNPSTSAPAASSSSSAAQPLSKLWEGSSTNWSEKQKSKKEWRKWWKKWKKWIYLASALLIAGIGVVVGVLVGLRAGKSHSPAGVGAPWQDNDGRSAWVTSGESLNITYVPERDGPASWDGTLSDNCPAMVSLNRSSPLNLLSMPFPAQVQESMTFTFPLSKVNHSHNVLTMANFTLVARGLGSSGTVEVVGTDAPDDVINGGVEGNLTIDVIAEYSGFQDLQSIIKVCTLDRDDGIGLGIYTPVETDGRVSNAYMLNPMRLPSFHVVIRFPPSAVQNTSSNHIKVPRMSFELDRMAVRFGDLENVVDFGELNVNSGRGGVIAAYAAAEKVSIWTGANPIRGKWNVSQSIMVNSTGGSIVSDVILYDPDETSDAVYETGQGDSPWRRRGSGWNGDTVSDDMDADGSDIDDYDPHVSSSTSSSPAPTSTSPSSDAAAAAGNASVSNGSSIATHSVSTIFVTTQGFVSTSYLYHPPKTALEALIVNHQGDIRVSLHPNYNGPFIANNFWGQVRLEQPSDISDLDPMDEGRTRSYLLGPVGARAGSLFALKEFNASALEDSGSSVSGVATWLNASDKVVPTPETVQNGKQSAGEVLIMGGWGDTTVAFDGKV